MRESEQPSVAGFFTAAEVRPLAWERLALTLGPVRKRLRKLRYQTVSDIHKARVEIRKARATLTLFSPALRKKRSEGLEKALRAIGQALGPIRDLDVLVERSFSWSLQRTEALVQLTYCVAEQRNQRLREALGELVANLESAELRSGRGILEKRLVSGREWRKVLESGVREELLLLGAPLETDAAPENDAMERLHERRKRCRQLRYQLEFLQAATSKDLSARFFRDAQSALGRVQDSAIIIERLNAEWGEWTGRKLRAEILGRQSEELGIALKQLTAFWNAPEGWRRAKEAVESGLS
jgi:CHAD domain-containing protein